MAVPRAAVHAGCGAPGGGSDGDGGTTGVLGAGGGAPGGPQDGPQRSRPFIQQASHSEDGMAAHNTVKPAAAAAHRPHSARLAASNETCDGEESTEQIHAFLTPLLYRLKPYALRTTHYTQPLPVLL